MSRALCSLLCLPLLACQADPVGLAPSLPAKTTVKFDFEHRPLPEIPLPNDLATRYDSTSATGRRVNASQLAPTSFERITREKIDQLDGWGIFSPISIPFQGSALDANGIVKAHWNDNYKFDDDVAYVINITKGSPEYGKPVALDVGNGNFPIILEDVPGYWGHDARGDTLSLLFEEHDEDVNKNGKFDPGEDDDLDGIFDKPNYLPGQNPPMSDTVARTKALMSFYERETNTLFLRPLRPLRQRETYAVVVTRRLKDETGQPVGSPYPWINHLAQNAALEPLAAILASNSAQFGGLTLNDVAFTWSFTTGSIYADLTAARDGLYGQGAQAHLQTEFPPDLALIHKLWTSVKDSDGKAQSPNLYIMPGEKMIELLQLVTQANIGFSLDEGTDYGKRSINSLKYVDYHVFGSFNTPMLLPRKDKAGNYLSYNEMVWPADLDRVSAPALPERATFWLAVPRKEVSSRKDGTPASMAIIGHGYTGNKLTTAQFAGYFARHGMATLCLENVSHGFDLLDKGTMDQVSGLLEALGMPGVLPALLSNRSWDQDLDGKEDSGADFWTSYTFHTRDVVRQSAVDYMQLLRIFRAFDGKRTWAFDTNNDGKTDDKDLAGDFDGDGVVDVGGPKAIFGMTGSSLGGMMSAVVGGSEPNVSAVVPVCAGGGLGDVGIRSLQGGVREAVVLRMMGPLYVGEPDADGNNVTIQAVVPHLNSTGKVPVAAMAALKKGDSVLAENLTNGEYDCAYLREGGAFRVGLASDVDRNAPQKHRLRFFSGNVFVHGVRDEARGKACQINGATPVLTIDKFDRDVNYFFQSAALNFKKGDDLTPIAEGLGLHRARPETRRFMGIAQMVLDPADPAVLARQTTSGEQTFATGEVLKSHSVVVTTIGDMNVPASTGASIARAMGVIDFGTPNPDWGNRTALQVLIDDKVLEAVDKIKHFVTPAGDGVLFDVEDLSGSASLSADGTQTPYPLGFDGFYAPRLKTPLHTKLIADDGHGGLSGALFPYVIPSGKHDLDFPGEQTDKLKKLCANPANATQPVCVNGAKDGFFDHGALVLEGMVQYLASGGKVFPLEKCQSTWTCSGVPPIPPSRY